MSDARLTSLGEGKGPIVLQGAMEMEVAPFIKRLKGAELEVYGDFFFWRGTFGTRPLIISQTGIGTAAAGAATALACALYQPSLIVNQGTAGGYGDLAVGDVVLASALYNANARYLGRDGLRFMELGSLEHESVAAMDFPDVPPLLETDERLRYILEAFLKKAALPTARASSPQVINGTRRLNRSGAYGKNGGPLRGNGSRCSLDDC